MKRILMKYDEPSDQLLIELMKEVAIEARNKAILVKKQMSETILNEIATLQAKLKANSI